MSSDEIAAKAVTTTAQHSDIAFKAAFTATRVATEAMLF